MPLFYYQTYNTSRIAISTNKTEQVCCYLNISSRNHGVAICMFLQPSRIVNVEGFSHFWELVSFGPIITRSAHANRLRGSQAINGKQSQNTCFKSTDYVRGLNSFKLIYIYFLFSIKSASSDWWRSYRKPPHKRQEEGSAYSHAKNTKKNFKNTEKKTNW